MTSKFRERRHSQLDPNLRVEDIWLVNGSVMERKDWGAVPAFLVRCMVIYSAYIVAIDEYLNGFQSE